jgi:hypothetical protein
VHSARISNSPHTGRSRLKKGSAIDTRHNREKELASARLNTASPNADCGTMEGKLGEQSSIAILPRDRLSATVYRAQQIRKVLI